MVFTGTFGLFYLMLSIRLKVVDKELLETQIDLRISMSFFFFVWNNNNSTGVTSPVVIG